MDPNECINRLREHAQLILLAQDEDNLGIGHVLTEGHDSRFCRDCQRRAARAQKLARRADDMAALFQSLDEWLLRGGFAPADWHLQPESRMAALLADDEPNGV